MKNAIPGLVLLSALLFGCAPGLPNREKIIAGAEAVAAGPEFYHRKAGAGSSKGDHFLFQGDFIVPYEEYRRGSSQSLEKGMFCWDVFQRYGDFVRKKIDLDAIPNMIARGGADRHDRNSTRYDFAYESTDVTVIYDVEWFRGGPGQQDQSGPEVQVRYHIRIN